MATELSHALAAIADRGEWRGADANFLAARASLADSADRSRSLTTALAAAAVTLLVGIGSVVAIRQFTGTETSEPPVTRPVSTLPTETTTGQATVPPTTTTVPPTTTMVPSTITTVVPVTTTAPARDYLSCERLLERENSYGRALAYWSKERRPDGLDPDDDGIPCETTYPPAEVEALFGGPDGLRVTISEDIGTWTAEGPAVDAGLICPGGEKIRTDGSVPNPWFEPEGTERYRDALMRVSDRIFVCDDGSGEFTIGADLFFDVWGGSFAGDWPARDYYGAWYVLEGTGRYEQLTGGGAYRYFPDGSRSGSPNAEGYLSFGGASQ